MTTEAEWLNNASPVGGVERSPSDGLPAVTTTYTISEASQHINELEAENARWLQDYTLLAEVHAEVLQQREAALDYVSQLEGLRDQQFAELREAHGEIDQLRSERDTLRAKADYPRTGW